MPRIILPSAENLPWFAANAPASHNHALRVQAAKAEIQNRVAATDTYLRFVSTFSKTQPYLPGWFHRDLAELLTDFIAAVERRASPRIIITCPPRAGKSELTSRCLAPYIFGKHPEWEIISATYAQDFANEWGMDVRTIMQDPRYQELFPQVTPRKDSDRKDGFRLDKGGSYTTRGRGGGLTGRGGDVILVDDVLKDRADADSPTVRKSTIQWYESVLQTRAMPGAGIIIIGTRWHYGDLIGHLLDRAKDNPEADQWVLYEFPAIATKDERHRKIGQALHPERYDEKFYARLRASMDPREFSALYQCNPTPDDGAAFKREWLKLYKPGTAPANLTIYVTSDYALGEKQTNDYSVLCTWGVAPDASIYLLHTERFKCHPGELAERTLAACRPRAPRPSPAAFIMEDIHITKTLGPHLITRARELNLFFPVETYTPTKDKLQRSASFRARMQQGLIHLPDEPFTHDVLIPELLQFPQGKTDDFCDNGTLLGLHLDKVFTPSAPTAPKPTGGTGTWEELQSMMKRQDNKTKSAERTAHIPTRLSGRRPERLGRDALLSRPGRSR
jgi:predicted phage terminase large subunit-like protein